jgi:glucokinase
LGTAVANFVHLFAPDIVVLGGGLVEAMPEIYVEEVSKSAHERVMQAFVHTFRIVAAELGDDAAVIGAAAWAAAEFESTRSTAQETQIVQSGH